MTALAADRITLRKEPGGFKAYPMAASTKIYAGSLVCVNAAGLAVPAANTAAFVVVGVADAQYDNSAGLASAMWCKVYTKGLHKFAASSITQAMVGTQMYVVDDQTFDDATGANSTKAGFLVEFISTTEGWLRVQAD